MKKKLTKKKNILYINNKNKKQKQVAQILSSNFGSFNDLEIERERNEEKLSVVEVGNARHAALHAYFSHDC